MLVNVCNYVLDLYILEIMINFSKTTYNATRCDTRVEILLHLDKPSCMDITGKIKIPNGKCICVYRFSTMVSTYLILCRD